MSFTALSAGAFKGAAYAPEARNDVLLVFTGSPWGLLAMWLLIINTAAFLTFGLDKWKARRKRKKETVRRIPEKNLFLLALAGGSIGALLGMKVWHHKTLHRSFRYGIPAILLLQVLLALGLWVYFAAVR